MARRGNIEKPKNMKGTFLRVMGDFRSQKWSLVFVSILCVVSAVISVVTPILLASVLQDLPSVFGVADPLDGTVVTQVDWPYVYRSFGIILAMYMVSAVSSWLSTWIVEKVIAVWVYEQRARIKVKLDRLPLSYFDAHQVGDILSRATNDIDNIGRNFASVYRTVCSSVIILVGGTVAMFVQNWALSLVVLPFPSVHIRSCPDSQNARRYGFRQKQ